VDKRTDGGSARRIYDIGIIALIPSTNDWTLYEADKDNAFMYVPIKFQFLL
jgi:hypothetical protein